VRPLVRRIRSQGIQLVGRGNRCRDGPGPRRSACWGIIGNMAGLEGAVLLRAWGRGDEGLLARLVVEGKLVQGSRECVDGTSNVGLRGLSELASVVVGVVEGARRERYR
jgi:hypothetical protein